MSLRYYDSISDAYRIRPRYLYATAGLIVGFLLGLILPQLL